MKPSTVSVHIGEIVIDGVAVADVGAFRAAVMDTLTRLAAEHAGGYPSGEATLLVGTPVVAGGLAEADLGVRVAHSVWRSIVPPAAPPAMNAAGPTRNAQPPVPGPAIGGAS
jgi:hypothetical protein